MAVVVFTVTFPDIDMITGEHGERLEDLVAHTLGLNGYWGQLHCDVTNNHTAIRVMNYDEEE